MKRYFLKAFYTGILLTYSVSMSTFAQGSPTYDNLTVNKNAGIGTTIDINHPLTVMSPTGVVGSGMGPLYVRRTGTFSSTGLDGGGTSWAFLSCDAAVRGYSYWGNVYSAGVGAWSDLDYTSCAALVAASTDGTTNTKLAYKDATSIIWPGYFTTPGANVLKYSICLRNPNGTDAGGSATGILLSVEGIGEFGKGGIVYERKKPWARGSIHFLQEPNANSAIPGLGNKVMTITNAGVVGIGIEPSSTTTNKLEVQGNAAVKGQISCNSLKVTATISPWPDYVFNNNFQARPLSETESYIKKNGHLPGMPTAKEVAKNGIDVGEMQAKLLKSMEEMTLQMIALKKENDQLKNRLDKIAKN